MKSLGSRSCVLLAGTAFSALALQQCLAFDAISARPGDGQIILAQAPDPKDPKAKKPAPAAPPKGAPAATAPVKPAVQPAVPPRNLQAVQPPTQPRVIAPVAPFVKPAQTTPPSERAATDPNQQNPQLKKLQPSGQPPVGARQVPPAGQPTGQTPAVGARRVAPTGQPAALGEQKPLGVQPVKPAFQNVDQVRAQRKIEVVGNQKILVEPDQRMIVRDGKKAFIRHDENHRFRLLGVTPRLERRGNEQFAYVKRPGGYQIISVTDGNGRLLQRMRRGPDGRDVILINNRRGAVLAAGAGAGLAAALFLGLAAPVIHMPRDQYIVDVSAARPDLLYDALDAEPLEPLERAYSLDEIRYNVELRDRLRRLDIDSITFASGAWEITPEQYPALEAVANAMKRILSRKPNAVFLIEGHTDAVGNEDDNLSLSDHRAEAVAVALTDAFQIPPENLVTQGYGEQFLKVPTDGPNRSNRRVTVRNIFRLLAGS